MKLLSRLLVLTAFACAAWAADSIEQASHLAKDARKAQDSGQLVQAYILFGEAVAADPSNSSYRANRNLLAPIANLLTKAQIESVAPAAAAPGGHQTDTNPVPTNRAETNPFIAKEELLASGVSLEPLPHVEAKDTLADFDVREDDRKLFTDVAAMFGVKVIFDREFTPKTIQFTLNKADFPLALEALTAATGTFVFPVTPHTIYVAPDSTAKRAELEPDTLETLNVPQAMNQQSLVEAAGAVRTALGLRTMAWDSENHEVMIVDKASRARIARSLLESLLLPKGQVNIEVQILTIDRDVSYNYGLSLPTSYQIFDFGHLGGFKSVISAASSAMTFLAFGSGVGPAYFGVSLASATLLGTFSDSFAKNVYDAHVVVTDGQMASFHVGDKYPIPTSIYSGYQQTSGSSLYNPIGQVNMEDLGLILKLMPRITSDGDVSIEIEADYKTLGTATIDTVPEINERAFKGNVRMAQDEWAVIAGIDQSTQSFTRTGLIGLAEIPGVNELFSETTRDKKTNNTLIVIKPVITILPMSSTVSPQFLLGPTKGVRVLL